ncbi:MAG: DUF2203 domain-containing protein [Candidatus Omnitrophica bacterium]|nr:DUF2203 domain-containing protein [Candidatus Omnitrophota bacterium]
MNRVKLFTLKEANQMLPLVRRIVQDILAAGKRFRMLSSELGAQTENDQEALDQMNQLQGLFRELEELGCSYKDWDFSAGLVDFPAVIGGREVFLCWRSDEEKIRYYHEVDAGFTGRKLIPEDIEETA